LSVRPQYIEARERVLIPVGEKHYPDGHTVHIGRLGFGGWEVRFNVAETNGRATACAPFDHANGVHGVT
jgi:hypothetical protein